MHRARHDEDVLRPQIVGALRDPEVAAPMASALLGGPTRKTGPNWAWLDVEDFSTFADLEQETRFKSSHLRGYHGVQSGGGETIPTASGPFGVLLAYSSRERTFAGWTRWITVVHPNTSNA